MAYHDTSGVHDGSDFLSDNSHNNSDFLASGLHELACFLDCVAGIRKPPVDGRTAMRVLEIARSLTWSAGAKQEVEL